MPFDDDGFVGHRGHVRAACRARAHNRGNLRDALRRETRLIEEDAAEMFAIREDLGLHRKKCAARIDEVDARQPVLQGDLLRAQMFLHRHRVIRAAFHRRIVSNNDDIPARHDADAGDDAGARRVVLVHAIAGQRRELEKPRIRVDQTRDALADGQFALLAMTLHVFAPRPRVPRRCARAAR